MILNNQILKQYSPFPRNYDLTEIMQYVDIAEKIWIVPLIGADQYDELQTQIDNNELTPENSTLLVEAIWPLLGFATCYESIPFAWSHISEVGLTKGKSDNSDSLTLKDITYVENHLRRQVEARKDFAIKWIKERIEYFPLINYCNCECSCCGEKAKLNIPNPQALLWSTRYKRPNLF